MGEKGFLGEKGNSPKSGKFLGKGGRGKLFF